MPIETLDLADDRIVIAVLVGEVTGPELVAWRLDLGRRLDTAQHHIVYDLLAYAGRVDDGDLKAMESRLSDAPTTRQTVVVSRDPMMPLWIRSVALRAGSAVPGRRISVVGSREAAMALLRASGA